jgi:integrase
VASQSRSVENVATLSVSFVPFLIIGGAMKSSGSRTKKDIWIWNYVVAESVTMKKNNREITLAEYLTAREKLSGPELAIFDFLYLTGARISESLETKRHDLNLSAGTAYIHTKKTPALPYRTVHFYPFEKEAKTLIENLYRYAGEKENAVLMWEFLNRAKPRTYLWELARAKFDCTIHSFRHTHAIQLARDVGLNIVELQAEMGWDDPGMAVNYLKYGYGQAIEKKMGLFKTANQSLEDAEEPPRAEPPSEPPLLDPSAETNE